MKKRILSMVMALIMVLCLLPAAVMAQSSITVYVTISDKGSIAVGSDGAHTLMAQIPVSVPAENGAATVDAALTAVHEKYSAGGAADYSQSGGFANKLWGVKTGSLLFFVNDKGLATGVTADTVSDGDYLTAAIMGDTTTYSDVYAYFDTRATSALVNSAVPLKLTGIFGMGGGETAALGAITVGTVSADGTFTQLGVTGSDGSVQVSFPAAGTYYVTAKGTVATKADDYSNYPTVTKVDVNAPTIAPVCKVTVVYAPVEPPVPTVKPEAKLPFNDVKGSSAESAIAYVYDKKLMSGVSADSFAPDAVITRAMAVTVLWTLAGAPGAKSAGFTDLTDGWYAAAANWAKEKGVSAGCGNGAFCPNSPISKEELCTMLYVYTGAKAGNADLSAFSDAADASAWAVPALSWANAGGYVPGAGSKTLDPSGSFSRAQFAVTIAAKMLNNGGRKKCRKGIIIRIFQTRNASSTPATRGLIPAISTAFSAIARCMHWAMAAAAASAIRRWA